LEGVQKEHKMKNRILLLTVLVLLLVPQAVLAAEYRLSADLAITFELPSERWQVVSEAPESAIQAMIDDMLHEAKVAGKQVDTSRLRSTAEKSLQINDLYVYNPETAAYLMVSISPTESGEEPPTRATVKASVDWTVEAIKDNSDVESGTYRFDVEKLKLPGATYAYLLDSDSPLHGAAHNFLGIIGFVETNWVFLYYNDKAENSKDVEEMRKLLESVAFKP
jgi:hypothetical protein